MSTLCQWDTRHDTILEGWFRCIEGLRTISGPCRETGCGGFTVWSLHSFICGQNINIKLPNVAVAQFKGFFPPIFLVDQVPSIKKVCREIFAFWNVPVINERNRMWWNLSIAGSEATGCRVWNISQCNLEPQICFKKPWTDQQHLPTLSQLLLVRTEFPKQMRSDALTLPETNCVPASNRWLSLQFCLKHTQIKSNSSHAPQARCFC